MPIVKDFSADGRIVRLNFEDPWTASDLLDLYQDEQRIFDNAKGHKIHTLADIRRMRGVPPGALSRRKSPNISHPNAGIVALVGASTFAKSLAELAFHLTSFERAKYFTDMGEAQAYLDQLIEDENKSPAGLSPSAAR